MLKCPSKTNSKISRDFADTSLISVFAGQINNTTGSQQKYLLQFIKTEISYC